VLEMTKNMINSQEIHERLKIWVTLLNTVPSLMNNTGTDE